MDIKWRDHVIIMYDKGKDSTITEALKKHLEDEFFTCDVVPIESAEYYGNLRHKTKKSIFNFFCKHARGLLRRLSRRRDIFSYKRIQTLMHTNGYANISEMNKKNPEMKRFVNIINRFDPVMVICTNPDSLRLMIIAREMVGKTFKIVGAISDFALDLSFVRSEADGYFVENLTVKNELERNGITESRIAVVGFPTLGFNFTGNRTEKRAEFGLTGDLPLVVVFGGVYETRSFKEDVIHLMKNCNDYSLMIITSDNTVRRYYMDLPEFNKNIMLADSLTSALLDITDVLVTVPDTRSIFEAFIRGIPVVVEPAVTMLEKKIRRYLLSRHLIIPARTPDETLYAVREILHEPDRALEFKYRGLEYAKSSIRDMGNMTPKISNDGILKIAHSGDGEEFISDEESTGNPSVNENDDE